MTATTTLAIFGGGIAVMGALFIAFFRALERGGEPVGRRGIEVTAQVVGTREHIGEEDPIYGGGGGGHAPVVSFRTRDGEVVAASSRHVYGPRRRVPADGTTVRIRYDPANPRRIYIRGWDTPARFTFSGVTAGGAFIVLLGAFMIVLAFTAA